MTIADLCNEDIVLDTNVLSHAENPGSVNQESALAVLHWMMKSNTLWVLDDNGKDAPNPWTSILYVEYHETLPPQSLSLLLLQTCLQSERVKFAARPTRVDREIIERLIPRNKRDRAVLGAARGSTDRILVSNDEADFDAATRKAVKKVLGVQILNSAEASVKN